MVDFLLVAVILAAPEYSWFFSLPGTWVGHTVSLWSSNLPAKQDRGDVCHFHEDTPKAHVQSTFFSALPVVNVEEQTEISLLVIRSQS